MNTKRYVLTSLVILFLTSGLRAVEPVRFGAGPGWGETVSEGLRETDGWKGQAALTLSPLGRNPFLTEALVLEGDISPEDLDLLLLAEPGRIENTIGHYRITGNYEISELYAARGEASIRPGPGGISLYPSSRSMWSPGSSWGDFTMDFRLRPTTLRNGEVFFSWQGRDAAGNSQSVVARVVNRRLVWEFRSFFSQGADRALNIHLESSPLIPGEWAHHRIRYKRVGSDSGQSGASPGLLEYLVNGIPTDMVHATANGREGPEPYSPKIGALSNTPLILAPSFSGYIDEFRLAPAYASSPPAGGYADRETSASGLGRTNPVDSGYPGSSLKAVRARVDMPGATRVRFFARVLSDRNESENIGFPDPGDENWIPLVMSEEPDDPTGFGRWFSWDAEEVPSGRYFIIGYILDPDPGADLAPVLSALEMEYEPRLPPRPPRDLRWLRGDDGRVRLSWSVDAEEGVAGWWISWGPRPGDYASTDDAEMVRGSFWIPKGPVNGDSRLEFTWPESPGNLIIYTSLRAAWIEGAPDAETGRPADYRALSEPTKEMNFRP